VNSTSTEFPVTASLVSRVIPAEGEAVRRIDGLDDDRAPDHLGLCRDQDVPLDRQVCHQNLPPR
jgi:hypothetical protein